jgi:hypothetical protein
MTRRLGKSSMEAACCDIARFGDADSVAARLAELAEAGQGSFLRARAARLGHRIGRSGVARSRRCAVRAVGFSLLAAEARLDQADALARRGDQRGATAARNRSAAIRRLLPPTVLTPTLARSLSLEPLSDREHEVALLAAQGMSSRDIASRLFVSTHDRQPPAARLLEARVNVRPARGRAAAEASALPGDERDPG